MRPLDGIVVADFSRVLAGPLATMTLGDLGADVIKVERPGTGDDTRAWGPPWSGSVSTYFLAVNRNKRSLVLDLAEAGDADLAWRLAVRADVVVENFLPGTMAAHGLGYDAVAAANPRVVYCSITGFGADGTAASMPGYDFLIQAMSGLMSITGDAAGPPAKVGVALVDMIAGLYATTGILAALHARDVSGVGQRLDVSLFDAALAALLNQGSAFLNAGVVPGRRGNQHPSIAPYQMYETADSPIAVAVGSEGTWRRLCAALEMPELADDARYATNGDRVTNLTSLNAVLTLLFAARPAADWIERLGAARVPVGAVNTVEQAYALAAELGSDPVSRAGAVRTARSPLRLSATPVDGVTPPPTLGQHDEEIRRWLSAG